MKLLLAVLLLLSAWGSAFAQKIEVKDDVILVDGAKYALIEKEGCGLMDVECMYYLKSLDGKRQFVVKQQEFVDPAEMQPSHPDGRVLYLQYVFTAAGARAETPFPTTLHLRAIDVARKVVKAHLFVDGALDPQAAADFVTNNGMAFSERRQALGGPKVIVIDRN